LSGPSGPAGSRTLAQHIDNMLDATLELGPQSPVWSNSQISMLCSYGFPVAGTDTSTQLLVTTPVRLVASQLLTPAGKEAFVQQLSTSIKSWPGWPGSSAAGLLIFDLNVYSLPSGASGPAPSLKPILEFESLRVRIADITDAA
jgi:hypothetical protein